MTMHTLVANLYTNSPLLLSLQLLVRDHQGINSAMTHVPSFECYNVSPKVGLICEL